MSDYGDLIQSSFGASNPALPQVVGNVDEDPERAQRAMDLAQATGVPSTAIFGDLDEFERQHKAAMASSIVQGNQHLADFVQSNPMVPKVANDDYGNLDTVSQKVSTFGSWLKSSNVAQGFLRGFGTEAIGNQLIPASETFGPDQKFAEATVRATAMIPELALRTVSGVISAGAYGVAGPEKGEALSQIAMDPGLQATLGGLGPPGVIAEGALAALGKVRPAMNFLKEGRKPPPTISTDFDKAAADTNAEGLTQLKEATDAAQQSVLRDRNPELFKQFIDQHTDAEIGVSGEVVAQLYGDKLPTADDGLLGWVPGIEDKLNLARATGDDVGIPLSDWLAKIDPKVMKELEDDIRVHPDGITANEVKLAGEQQEALRDLHEKGQEGVEEPTSYKEPEPLPELVPQTRAASALEPLFSVGDRKLQLSRLSQAIGEDPKSLAANDGLDWNQLTGYEQQRYTDASHGNKFGTAQGFHDFSINDEKGNPVGTLNISEQKGGKQLYVDMVNGIGGLGPRDFGPALMRSLLKQLKEEFPNAESITGHRVSGAREKAGSYMASSASPVVKLDALDTEGFSKLLEGGSWETYSPNTKAYIKPNAARSAEDRNLVNIVNGELDRIAPKKVAIQAADTIKADTSGGGIQGQRPGDSIKVGGTYIQYKDTYPIILYALDGENALGTARHEAIHHLRNYGFFDKEEWSTLEDQALAGGWLSKYNIDRRYPTGSPSLKLEESIAEAYMDWTKGQDALKDRAIQTAQVPSPLDAIFQKMKDFFDGIKDRISQLLGKDATWEDVFARVHTGEVGGREGTEPLDARAFNEKLSNELAANDNDTGEGDRAPTYQAALRDQQINKFVDASTKRGDFEYWKKVATEENHNGLNNKPNAFKAARAHSLDGKTTLVIGIDGKRTLFHNGVKQVRESTRDLGEKLSVAEPPEGSSRVFERAAALGMTTDQFKAYDKLIQARHAEDITEATKRATEEQAREHTKQWKEDRKALRQEVAGNIRQRPDVAADLFFGSGELYGKKVPLGSVKLDAEALTPEQKAGLPRNYYGEHGLHPDDVANLFGYGSGDAMVGRLVQYNQAKLSAGGMSAKDFVSRVTDIETDRQMQIKHGVLADNIVDAVKEQVSGETQQDILHEETVALGMKAGQAPLDKGTVVGQLRDAFAKMPLGSVSSDAYMRAAGKAGRQAELSLLSNDPAGAFKAKQQQYYATVIANEASKLEKDLGRFDKLAKRFSKREVASVDQEYTNFIHNILMRVGRPVRRSIQDLETEIQAGEYHSLKDFVEGKNGFYLREVAVADQLFDPGFRKGFQDLTVDEFRGVDMSVKSLLANGRDEKKITKAGVAEDLAVVKGQMIDQLKEFQEKQYDAKGGRWMGPIPPRVAKVLRTYGTAHIQMENLFNRWDHDDPRGVFQQYIMRDLVDAANNESVMEKRFASRLRDLDDKADLKKSIDNPLFKVPGTKQLMNLTRGNLRSILLNAGNEGNLLKMAKGYDIPTEALTAWLHTHATKEDWDWAQGMGNVFGDLKKEADVMYRNLSGVAPESIKINPVDTPHGQYPGWYYPLIAHPEFEGGVKKMMGKDALEQDGFVRSTTANGYTKGRTGASYPLALDLDMLPPRMKQMIHDIAMRPSIINASKIFYDKDIRSTVQTRFGTEWRDMLTPYLIDVANSANYMPKDQRILASASEFMRQNLISTLVGLNPGTVLKHGPTALVQSLHEVGAGNFLKALKGLTSINERTGETNWQFAMKTSEELQRRHQNYVETLGGATELLQPKSGFGSLRSTIQRFSASPVAISDLLSAVPTWMAQFEKSIGEGQSHGDSVYEADRAVRRAHGSIAITNRSSVMRGGALAQWMTSVYGFFNHIMNRQYELLWKSGEALDLAKAGNYSEAMKRAPELTSMMFAYVLAPALIEEAVTPLASTENESWGKKAVKGVAYTLGASWIGIRDLANAVLNGRDPAIGLLQTQGKALTDVFRDLGKQAPFSKEHAGKVVRDGSTLLGALTGVVPGQAGRVAQFGTGLAQGQEHPKGPWGWLTGARFGTMKNHPATAADWWHHHVGGH